MTDSVSEVDGQGLVWTTPKDHEARSVPVPRFLVEALSTHISGKDRDSLLFPSHLGQPLRHRAERRAWFDAASEAIGVPGLTPHELRHTAASLAVSAQGSVKAVQRMLGHKSAAMTLDTYADLFDDDLDALAQRMDSLARPNLARSGEFSMNVASVTALDSIKDARTAQ